MKYFSFIIVVSILFGCIKYNEDVDHTVYLDKGDYWINCYDHLNISSSVYKDNKLYCNTMNSSNNSEIFYCLDLGSGKVLWANKVSSWTTYNPIILDDVIYYVSYLCDRYAFDISGKQIWHKNADPPNLILGRFTYNAMNHNLIVGDIGNGFYEFEKNTGNLIQIPIIDGWKRTNHLPVHNSKYMYYVISSDSIRKSQQPEAGILLVCRNLKDNKTIWQIPIPSGGSDLYERDGNIFFINTNKVYSVNGMNGVENWVKYFGPNAFIDQHWHSAAFAKDQIQVQTNDSTFLAIDYKSGKIIPYYTKSDVFNYNITDNYRKGYHVSITVGSFNGNDSFENTTEVKVEKIGDK